MKFINAYSYHSSFWQNPRLMALALKVGLGPPMKMRPEALIFGYQMLQGWTVMDRLSEIKVPTLVMAGRYDFLFPPEHQSILADRIPNAHLEPTDCAGHNPQVEQPEVAIEIIRNFLATTVELPDGAGDGGLGVH